MPITVTCQGCGKTREIPPSKFKNGRGKFCTRACKSSREFQVRHFWERVDKTDGCWIWRGGGSEGYGMVVFQGRFVLAHRLAWELTNGEIRNGLFALHRCDNPPCCNPAHLFLGTHDDNAKDKAAKGRCVSLCGEESPQAKLTARDVVEMRRLRDTRGLSWRKLARRFHIGNSHARRVCMRESWRHVA
jgi:hypothetical protein